MSKPTICLLMFILALILGYITGYKVKAPLKGDQVSFFIGDSQDQKQELKRFFDADDLTDKEDKRDRF